MVVGRPVPFLGDPVALISDPVTVISYAVALVSGPVALVREAVTLIGGMVAFAGEAVTVVGSDLGLVQCRPALSQVGLGGLEGLLGRVGTGLRLPDPDIVQGQGGQPLALGVLDDLLGEHGQPA